MEVELIEPSLYLRTDPGAPARFANAFVRAMRDRDDGGASRIDAASDPGSSRG
jgi:hypothetical protein